jgi:hypothetical protein
MTVTEHDIKRELIQRIVGYLDPVPDGAVNSLLQKSVQELSVLLETMSTNHEVGEAKEAVEAHREESRREAAFDAAYTNAIRNVTLNGKYLTDSEANKNMLESLLNPGETPTAAGYATLVKQFSNRFSWHLPQPKKTDADREADFVNICHENLLSLCDANRQMHKGGVALENWAGASGLERAAFQAEAAQTRQTFLIKHASPAELKAEAQYQSATEREQAQREEADRQHQFVSQAQQGLYATLPTHNQAGEVMDSRYFRRLSTLDYVLFKQLVRKFGTAQITERLRTPAVAA